MSQSWTCATCGKAILLPDGGKRGAIWRHQRTERCMRVAKERLEKLAALRAKGCDCLDPEPPFGPALKSSDCSIHNEGVHFASGMPAAGGQSPGSEAP